MSTLNYAIRGSDGVVVRGQTTEDAHKVISPGPGLEISLNLSSGDISGYMQQGNDLVIHLVTGETITVENYFQTVDGEDRTLFVAQGDVFQKVELGEPIVDQYIAQYVDISTSEKWGAYDQLTFLDLDRIEPVVAPLAAPIAGIAPGLLGLGGAAAAAAAVGGGSGNGNGSGPIIPTVDNADVARIVGGTADDSVTITGTGEAGSSVTVTIGTATQTTTIRDDGTYSVTFAPGALPADGAHNSTVVVVSPDNTTHNLTGPAVDIDTTAPAVQVQDGTVSTGDIVNAAEQQAGHVISGTGEAGAALTVEIDGTTKSTTVSADGTWSVTFASNEIRTGDFTTPVKITSTDARGNVTVVNDNLAVDTIAPTTTLNTVEGDNIINAAEAADGVVLSGKGEAGSTLSIVFGGVTQTTTVDANGNWSSAFPASAIASGTSTQTVSITATDAAGNTSTATPTVQVDRDIALNINTSTGAFANTVNAVQMQGGVVLEGTTDPGARVTVTVEGVVRTTPADSTGKWLVTYESGSLQQGTFVANATVSATDTAGNTATSSAKFNVDTEISAPLVESVTFTGNEEVPSLVIKRESNTYDLHSLNTDGTTTDVATTEFDKSNNRREFDLNTPAPDGTHLVVKSEDAAGNKSDTLIVLDDNATNAGTIGHAAIGNFNIEAIDLDYAASTRLTLTEQQIKALSKTSDRLTIHGGDSDQTVNDQVEVRGAVKTNQTETIDGQTYDVYTVGNDGVTLVIDQDINVIV